MTGEPEEYLLAAEVGRLLRVSPKTVSRWAKEGKLPYSRTLGGHRRFPAGPIRALGLGLESDSLSVDEILRRLDEGGQWQNPKEHQASSLKGCMHFGGQSEVHGPEHLPEELASAFATLGAFAERGMLTLRVSDLEHDLAGRTREEASNALTSDNITPALLQAALGVKRVAGEINVIVHAFGILVSLPYVLQSLASAS